MNRLWNLIWVTPVLALGGIVAAGIGLLIVGGIGFLLYLLASIIGVMFS